MGICSSCDAAVATAATAKLILQDGELREFAGPVKVSHVLEKEDPAWFVCDSDAMDFDGFIRAVGADEELRPGQLYFVLPKSMMRHPLQAEDLAKLAVKASAALVGAVPGGKGRCRRIHVAPLVFDEGSSVDVVVGNGERRSPAMVPAKRRRRTGGKGVSFRSNLCAIPE